MPISLAIRGADGSERRADFDQAKVTVGADPLCDVPVADPGVDAEQCVLVAREERIELFDIGESGGVLVNGKPVGHAEIAPGDEIWIGSTVLRLLAAADEAVSFTEAISTVREELAAAPAPAPVAPAARPAAPPRDERTALLDQVQRLIAAITANENIFESVLDTMFSTAPVRRSFIAVRGRDGELHVKAHRSREKGASGEKIEVSRTLIGRVLDSGSSVLTSDAEADADFSAIRSIHRLRIKAAICVPLLVEGQVIGLLYGDNREQPGSLNKEHLSILTALASVAAVAVEQTRLMGEYHAKLKLEQALSIARSIQRNFLPSRPPAVDGVEVWGVSHSCDETGGDYFDYLELDDGRLAVVIADVTGHGVGPALLMATVRALLRALIPAEPSLETLLFRLNNHIRADVREGRFITLFLGVIDPQARTLRHVGAGHTPPVLCRAGGGKIELIASKGPPLGILHGAEFARGEDLALAPGDVLLFTTDGIIEADDAKGRQFGMDRLCAAVREHARGSAQEVGEAVMETVETFVEGRPLRDDATLVAIKVR